jgi:hypothetical protein
MVSYAENPFCARCYDERLRQAVAALGPVRAVFEGNYVRLVPV